MVDPLSLHDTEQLAEDLGIEDDTPEHLEWSADHYVVLLKGVEC